MDAGHSKWLDRFTTRPIWYFLIAFVSSMAILWVVLQVLSVWNSGPDGSPDINGIEATSAAVQAVVGTAVVGASALVALLVAVAALQASRQNNIHNDPDYLLSHQARSDYQKFGFLYGTMISLFRTQKHEAQVAGYGSTPSSEDASADVTPRWDPLARELKQLLSSTALQVASLEGARARDSSHGDGDGHNEHMLRRTFAEVLGTLEAQADNVSTTLPPGTWMLRILAMATLLGHELQEGLRAIEGLEPDPSKKKSPGLVGYMRAWAGTTSFVNLDPSFARALTSTTLGGEAFRARFTGGLKKPVEALTSSLQTLMAEHKDWKSGKCTDPESVGLHRAMSVAALIGDHATAQELAAAAKDFATKQKWTPYVANVMTKNDVEALASMIRNRAASEVEPFLVLTVSRKRLPVLFHGSLLNRHTRGCVIVDGLRTPDLTWLEESVRAAFEARADEEEPVPKPHDACLTCDACGGCARCGTCREDTPRELDLMLGILAMRAYAGAGQWGDPELGKINRDFPDLTRSAADGGAETSDGPAMLWVGIDYRQLGVEPPTHMDNWSCEMWSFFSRDEVAISEELQRISTLG
ncbi:hypothetical protein [Luteimonas sp. MHLX1A]|uniref:hypothetical protein n=1 Tax=Alterluteimonas muca TaxID=2878684 RepID=UPI001E474018|nr:hypothetical protein [Luteimonas sp. MHLX1A]MCD9046777.1 hypothetical protein [Luteimonas sp. MHLX1A]